MEDIYVNDILAALQEMKEETNSNEDDITLGWAITAIEHSIKMQDEIDALKSELKQLEKSDASKEQNSIDYYCLYKELKGENEQLKRDLIAQTDYCESICERFKATQRLLNKRNKKLRDLKAENKALKERLEKATKAFYELLNKYENGDREVNPIDYYYKKAVESDKENKEND